MKNERGPSALVEPVTQFASKKATNIPPCVSTHQGNRSLSSMCAVERTMAVMTYPSRIVTIPIRRVIRASLIVEHKPGADIAVSGGVCPTQMGGHLFAAVLTNSRALITFMRGLLNLFFWSHGNTSRAWEHQMNTPTTRPAIGQPLRLIIWRQL
jgi:hypothetical protein